MQHRDRIERQIRLQDLRILMTVIEAGTMGKAAQHLNSTQPAISRSIAELEQALGVRLLDRHRHGVEPTEHGRTLLNCGMAVFDELRQGLKRVEFLSSPSTGEIRIGSTAFLAASFVAAVVNHLSGLYPGITFHFVTGSTESLQRDLYERRVDLLVLRKSSTAKEEKLDFEFLFDDSFAVAVGAHHPLAGRRRVTLAELVNEAWALPSSESAIGSVAIEAFRNGGLELPRTSVVAILPEIRLSLLRSGRFLTIFPLSVLRFPNNRPDIKVLPVRLQANRVPVGIVTIKNRSINPVAQLFIEHAREVAKSVVKGKRKS